MNHQINANTTPLSVETLSLKKTPLLHKMLVVVSLITLIGGSLTGIMTYLNLGGGDSFYQHWISSFLLAALVMAPIGFLMMSLMNALVDKLLVKSTEMRKNIVVSILMAVLMESLLAFVTTANNIGFADARVLLNSWFEAVLAALPIGLTIMLMMSVTIKPKLVKFLKS
jgi:hypothetical protein